MLRTSGIQAQIQRLWCKAETPGGRVGSSCGGCASPVLRLSVSASALASDARPVLLPVRRLLCGAGPLCVASCSARRQLRLVPAGCLPLARYED